MKPSFQLLGTHPGWGYSSILLVVVQISFLLFPSHAASTGRKLPNFHSKLS